MLGIRHVTHRADGANQDAYFRGGHHAQPAEALVRSAARSDGAVRVAPMVRPREGGL